MAEASATRSPICTVLGHVDHGKSSILDYIRRTAIVKSEAGAITQAIGASMIPLSTIRKTCGKLLDALKIDFTIPGLLFIDTPGHAAFTSMRKRGGSLADIAILVIDINEGIKPQTIESIEILKASKTPFIIAANKVDLIQGWNDTGKSLMETIQAQSDQLKQDIDNKIYTIVGELHEKAGITGDYFNRIDDYAKTVAIIPTSATTGKGLPELLMVIAGLAQRYLEGNLQINTQGAAKGTVLEVKEEKGMGTVLDTIIYDGCLSKNDTLVIGGLDQPIVTKVKALFEPKAHSEMRDKKAKFDSVPKVVAATGVRICGTDLKGVVGGMPLVSATAETLETTKEAVQQEVQDILIATDQRGIIIKADSIGSLEAMTHLLHERDVAIKKAGVGNITKKDLTEAEASFDDDPLQACILGFNVCDESGVVQDKVKIISGEVIYKIIEDFEAWQEEQSKKQDDEQLSQLTIPCKVELLRGYVFRQNNPAIVGAEVIQGKLKTGIELMNSGGARVGTVKNIQMEKESLSSIESGKQIAVAIDGPTVGRQIQEGEILYSFVPENQFRKMKEAIKYLKKEEIELIKEIAAIMRKENSTWGV